MRKSGDDRHIRITVLHQIAERDSHPNLHVTLPLMYQDLITRVGAKRREEKSGRRRGKELRLYRTQCALGAGGAHQESWVFLCLLSPTTEDSLISEHPTEKVTINERISGSVRSLGCFLTF